MRNTNPPLNAAAKRGRPRAALMVCALAGALLYSSTAVQTQQQYGFTVPSARPRLWFDSARLAQARTWHQSNPFTPASDNLLDNALLSLLTGQASYCRTAINLAMGMVFPDIATSSSSNEARWFGEQVYLTWDWCYPHMTTTERQTLQDRWNTYNEQLRLKAWGGPDMFANNYHWGYLRNELAWAIASYGQNSMADTFLQDSLVTRWQNGFVPYSRGQGAGGAATEGSQYGPYLLGYSAVPFQTLELMGRRIYDETDFYQWAVYNLIYGTSTASSVHRGAGVASGWEMFPHGDDQFWRYGNAAANHDYGTFMTVAANRWANTPLGRHARQWLNTVRPPRHRFVQAVDTATGAEGYSSLPLDFLAPGPGIFYSRSNWSAGGTAVHLLLGDDGLGTGHSQDDWGFQIWRGGRWLSRETTAYAEYIAGHAGGSAVNVTSVYAHNGIAMNGTYVSPNNYQSGSARVVRLQSATNFSYAATDLTSAYRATNRPQNDNPAVSNIVREYLYLRPFETLVVFDRLRSNAVGTTPAANVPKTFLAHFETAPQVTSSRSVLGVNGNQALRLQTLVPANPVYRVVDEATNGGTSVIAQYRLEVETSGSAESYFLHVLQARDSTAADIVSSVTEDASSYRVTLTHSAGSAIITFNKGMASSGGSISINGGSTQSFLDGVQQLSVTPNGPVWGAGVGTTNPTQPPAAPRNLRINR